jgi:hypothetical protein
MSAIVAEPMSTSRLDPVPLRVEHTDEMVVVLTVGRPLLGAGRIQASPTPTIAITRFSARNT